MDGINLWLLDVISLRPAGLSVLFSCYLPKFLCIACNAQVMLIQSFEVPFKSRILCHWPCHLVDFCRDDTTHSISGTFFTIYEVGICCYGVSLIEAILWGFNLASVTIAQIKYLLVLLLATLGYIFVMALWQ